MRFLTTFNVEFYKAVAHYAALDKKLARDFIDSVEETQRRIDRFPRIGKLRKGYRCLPVHNFPYTLCYIEDHKGKPLAVVLFHYKRQKFPM